MTPKSQSAELVGSGRCGQWGFSSSIHSAGLPRSPEVHINFTSFFIHGWSCTWSSEGTGWSPRWTPGVQNVHFSCYRMAYTTSPLEFGSIWFASADVECHDIHRHAMQGRPDYQRSDIFQEPQWPASKSTKPNRSSQGRDQRPKHFYSGVQLPGWKSSFSGNRLSAPEHTAPVPCGWCCGKGFDVSSANVYLILTNLCHPCLENGESPSLGRIPEPGGIWHIVWCFSRVAHPEISKAVTVTVGKRRSTLFG